MSRRKLPTALMWVPGCSASPSNTGVLDEVATHTKRAASTAASADGAATRLAETRGAMRSMNAARLPSFGP